MKKPSASDSSNSVDKVIQCLRCFSKSHVSWSLALYTTLVVLMVWPTLNYYIWFGHEEFYPVLRISRMCHVWRFNGPFHTPWMPDTCHGYGWPFFTFYAPLGYYVGAIGHFILNLNYGGAARLSFYISIFLSGLGMYGFAWSIISRQDCRQPAYWALTAATMYSLAPYHLTDVFARVSLAESWGWAAVACVFWGVEVSRTRSAVGIFLIGLMYALLMLSHNITALYGSVFLGLYVLLTAHRWTWWLAVMAGGGLGAAMSAYYWYPALRLLDFVRGSDVELMGGSAQRLLGHAVHWRQHLVETHGKGPSIIGPDDQLGIQLGLIILGGATLATLALVRPGLNRAPRYRLGVCLTLLFIVLFIMSPQMPWEIVPALFHYVQFPWRLMIFADFFGCAAVVMAAPVINRWVHPLVLAAAAAALGVPVISSSYLKDSWREMDDQQLETWRNLSESKGKYLGAGKQEYMPRGVEDRYLNPEFFTASPAPQYRLSPYQDELNILDYQHRGTAYFYHYQAQTEVKVKVHVFHFPGWRLEIDGRHAPNRLGRDRDGLVQLSLPAGEHELRLEYLISPVGRRALLLSYFGWMVWSIMGIGIAAFYMRPYLRRRCKTN